MRIAQVTYSYKPIVGGADVWADLLRRVCESAGHDVVVYQRPAEGLDDPVVRPIHSWLAAATRRRAEFWTLPFGLPRYRSELAQRDVLVVHYPPYHRFVEWHPRTVLVSHGVFWDDRPQALSSRIKRALARRAYRKARAVVANDTFFLREMGETVAPGTAPFTEVAQRRFFVPNCVDTARFRPTKPLPELTGFPLILVPRNLYFNRGVHLAIEAFARCAQNLGDARLVVVGTEGQKGYLQKCKHLADGLGIAERVVFFGPVAWEKMPQVYSAAAVTLIPTLAGEGTSLSALESMACGTPTVTTDVGGLADLPALQCKPTPRALAEALRTAWRDRERLGREQREVVCATYNIENWSRTWLEILDTVLRE